MKTKTSLSILILAALLLGVGYFTGVWLTEGKGQGMHTAVQGSAAVELAWMKKDFSLGDDEFMKVCALHEAYRPVCAKMCTEVNRASQNLASKLEHHGKVNAEVEAALRDYDRVRGECERATLDHLMATAGAMNSRAGREFLRVVLPRVLPGDPHSHAMRPSEHAHD